MAVDFVCARLMGFDYRRLLMLLRALEDHPLPLVAFTYDDLTCRSPDERFQGRLAQCGDVGLVFEPHFGWKGHVESRVSDRAGHGGRECVA